MKKHHKKNESRPELIERAVDDHIKGIERKDIDLVSNPEELEYLRFKSDLIILHSEENANLQFNLLQEKIKENKDGAFPLVEETTPHYLPQNRRRDN